MSDSAIEFTQAEKEVLLKQAMQNLTAGLIGYFTKRGCDLQTAENLSQSVWLSIYKHSAPYEYERPDYLFRKARQVWIDELRKRGCRPELDFVETIPEESLVPHAEPSSPEEEASLFTSFWEVFEELDLTDHQKRIFWLKERYDFTLDDISSRLNIARSTVHDHLKLVKKQCREYLTQPNE